MVRVMVMTKVWREGQTEGQTDRRTDRGTDRQKDRQVNGDCQKMSNVGNTDRIMDRRKSIWSE
jgi:hypothetical protein